MLAQFEKAEDFVKYLILNAILASGSSRLMLAKKKPRKIIKRKESPPSNVTKMSHHIEILSKRKICSVLMHHFIIL